MKLFEGTSLGFCEIPTTKVTIPPPKPNGGRYTGEPALAGSGWEPVTVSPEHHKMINETLLTANPPPQANMQYQACQRPGNNTVLMPGVQPYSGVSGAEYQILCLQKP